MKASIKRETFTPAKARRLLDVSANIEGFENRAPAKSVVSRYAGDITRGHWFADTGETIKLALADDGKTEFVIDGQHRLMAVVEANAACAFWVMRHVPVAAFQYLDQGKPRDLVNIFQMESCACKPQRWSRC